MSKKDILECKACSGIKSSVKKISSSLASLEIFVPSKIVSRIEKYTVNLYKNHSSNKGFLQGEMPEEHVREYFGPQIEQDIKKFILKYIVLDYLQNPLNFKDTPGLQFPRLKEIINKKNGELSYVFHVTLINQIDLSEWKKLSFSPPRRKLYKDLDRQAQMFLENEVGGKPRSDKAWQIANGDWVRFKVQSLTDDNSNALKGHSNNFWMKISTTYLVDNFQQLFFGKMRGESFCINKLQIQDLPDDSLSRKGRFNVIIDTIWRSDYFCLDFFKQAFGLISAKDIHDKLIEVFSFRNDISQRRSIVEETFRALFSRFRLEVPRHLVLRRHEQILKNIKDLPDYHVYKSSSNFVQQVEDLSERQLREESIIDFILQNENLSLENDDIEKYLNLFSNSRLTEFVYFRPQAADFGRTVLPIREQSFSGEVLREKALNFIINSISNKDCRFY